ncbi:glutaredoxin family protein [Micromonospora sp. DT81.3]|uniref:glutaredoxin family protein n=1 Tax=Micromonospora sp. DT81.3 TaxID=3416523 RepID=UPI003CEEE588
MLRFICHLGPGRSPGVPEPQCITPDLALHSIHQFVDSRLAEQITVYTTGPSCARCTLTKNVLTRKGVEFVEVDIRDNPAARAYVVEELGYSDAPVVVVSDEDHWSGFRPDHIDRIAVTDRTSNR